MTEDVVTDALACRHPDPERVGDDPCFATAIYRAALHADWSTSHLTDQRSTG
jgi:hypothetical protein